MPVKRIAFDELLPDMPAWGETNGMAEAVNVLPLDSRWRPVRKPYAVAVTATLSPAFGDPLILGGLYSHARRKAIFGLYMHVSTPEKSLWEVDEGLSTITNVSKGGNYSAGGAVRGISFCEFNDFFIATWVTDAGAVDPVQYIDATAAAFADLFTSALKPNAKYLCTSKVHLVLGWTQEGGTNFPRRIRWSAQGDPQDMDTGSARAGFIDLDASDGEIRSLAGFEDYFLVWTDSKVFRFDYVGGIEVWYGTEIGSGPEGMLPGMTRSVVSRAGGAMYRGRDGYKVVAPSGEIIDLGEGKIRSLVQDPGKEYAELPGAIDKTSGLVAWIGEFGVEADRGNGLPIESGSGKVLIFNPTEGRFSVLEDVVVEPSSGATEFNIGVPDEITGGVLPVYSPNNKSPDGLGNIVFLWWDETNARVAAYRLGGNNTLDTDYSAARQKSRIIEPVPGGTSMLRRVRPLVELEEGAGKTAPTVQVKIEGWNDLYKKTAAFPAVTLDTDTDLNTEGWMVGPLPLSADRWEFTLILPELDSATEYVPINLLGIDVEFDEFSEK